LKNKNLQIIGIIVRKRKYLFKFELLFNELSDE